MQYLYNLGLKFYDIADKNSDRIAIKYFDKEYTYSEINTLSNQIAHYLVDNKISENNVVGIFNNKTLYGFASMLACLKIGAIYVNLDITSPAERLKKIIETCRPNVFLNDFEVKDDIFTKSETPSIQLNNKAFQSEIKKLDRSNLELTKNISGNAPAYIMFTSGSTGFPKGAAMSHDNVLKFIDWGKQTYKITTQDTFTNVNPLYFDNSVFDFYMSLLNGATLAPFSYETIKDARKTVDYANIINPTIWFSVPSLLVYLITTKSFKETDMPNLRVYTFGGEGFPKPKLKQLYDMFGDRVRFVNVYGPTECTCICSSYDITKEDFNDLSRLAPLGKIAPNFKAVILPGKESKEGELCLGGMHVGLGYYNDIERTEKSFIQNPLNKATRELVYKTGDIVKKDPDGLLHFIGRIDNQIKHMGYRIELEEIEAAFNSLEYINECGVIYKKLKVGGQIIAFISTKNITDKKRINQDIKKNLPPYMVPKSIKFLDILPKNKNGKIDRIELEKY